MTQGGPDGALERLAEEITHCERCDLFRTANRAVPGDGPSDATIMLVGEAPGFNEDKQGHPFVGAAGKFLDHLLSLAGLSRGEVFITNVVKHRPPNNRDPQPAELAACRPWLEAQLEIIRPRLVVTLGRFSLGTFFPGARISQMHGQLQERDGRWYFFMYHPAAALHQQTLRDTLEADMKTLGRFLQSARWKETETTPGQAPAGTPDGHAPPEEEKRRPPEQLTLFAE